MSASVDDIADVYTKIGRKARKEHICCSCSVVIRPGHRYTLVTSIYDGSVSTWKRCPRCEHIHCRLVDRLKGDPFEWPEEDLGCGHDWPWHIPEDLSELAFMTDEEVQIDAVNLTMWETRNRQWRWANRT